MRVILANHTVFPFHSHFGGVEKRVFCLAKYLAREGVETTVLSSMPRSGEKRAYHNGIDYFFVPPILKAEKLGQHDPVALIGLSRFSSSMSKFLIDEKFDILHAHLGDPYFYLRKRIRRPVVFQPFEEVYLALKNAVGSPREKLIRRLKGHVDKFCMTHADAVASESDEQTKTFSEMFGIGEEKIFTLPVGVDVEYIDELLENRTVTRQSLGLNDQDFVLITVNRLEPVKGVEFLVDALAGIVKEIPSAKLILIGTGSQESTLKEKIARYGLNNKVIHLHNVPETKLYQCLSLSDVYISPTLHMVSVQGVIEAMACGLPVVSTGQEFWVQNGLNGYVVKKMNASEITSAVVKICEGAAVTKFGLRSREMAENYSYRKIAKIAIRKYEQLLDKPLAPTVC